MKGLRAKISRFPDMTSVLLPYKTTCFHCLRCSRVDFTFMWLALEGQTNRPILYLDFDFTTVLKLIQLSVGLQNGRV